MILDYCRFKTATFKKHFFLNEYIIIYKDSNFRVRLRDH